MNLLMMYLLQNIMLYFIMFLSSTSYCHIVDNKAQLNELKKLCEHAYTCFHDTIFVCGKSVNEARTFLDLCDMYEYACEFNMVFRHVKEEEGVCPNPQELGAGLG